MRETRLGGRLGAGAILAALEQTGPLELFQLAPNAVDVQPDQRRQFLGAGLPFELLERGEESRPRRLRE